MESFTFEHIYADLDRTGARIIILDNITALALKTTADADVSIGIMKGLKRLQVERGISSLVLAHTPKLPPGAALTLNHLAGSKHLSNFADSVFFIGRSVQGARTRYVKQVKNRTDEELPGVLVCELSDEDGYLGFTLRGTDDEAPHLGMRDSYSRGSIGSVFLPAQGGRVLACSTGLGTFTAVASAVPEPGQVSGTGAVVG